MFALHRALAIAWKDLLDLSKNRGLLWSMAVFPAVVVAAPIGVVASYARNPSDPSLRTIALYYEPGFPAGASAARFLIDRTLLDFFAVYLLMPLFIPILISSQSVSGEKERRTLEPLLASPVGAGEILAGKSAAALLPAVAISWLAFAALCVGVDLVAWPLVGGPLLPSGLWLFGVGVVAPLFAFFGNAVAILVSARVADGRLAQQISGLITLPLLGLVGAQVAGWLRAGPLYYAVVGALVLVLDVAAVIAAVRLFDRERLLTRWS